MDFSDGIKAAAHRRYSVQAQLLLTNHSRRNQAVSSEKYVAQFGVCHPIVQPSVHIIVNQIGLLVENRLVRITRHYLVNQYSLRTKYFVS